MSNKVSLIGVVNTDPWGYSRLERAIREIEPSALIIRPTSDLPNKFSESVIDSIIFTFSVDEVLNLDHTQIDDLKAGLKEYGYQLRIASEYEKQGFPVFRRFRIKQDENIDDQNIPRHNISGARSIPMSPPVKFEEYRKKFSKIKKYLIDIKSEILTQPALLAHYITMTSFGKSDKEAIIEQIYNYHKTLDKRVISKSEIKMDEAIEKEIRRLCSKYETIMVVGNIRYVFGNYYNLFERLNCSGFDVTGYKLNKFKSASPQVSQSLINR